MPASPIRIITKGYWPLPKFAKMWQGGWKRLKAAKVKEKEAEYSFERSPPSKKTILVIEAAITKALPKKIIVFVGPRHSRFVLSRWMGGIYSNADGRRLVQLRAFYDAIAPIYRYHVEPEREKQLAAFVPLIPAGSKVLDASAGDCTFAKVAGQRAKDGAAALDVWCNDISKEMLKLRGPGIPPSRISVSSASDLPFPSCSFDAVVHTFSNVHSLDRKFFRSFHRVLRQGGVLLYHPVKAPGEQWPKDFGGKVEAALRAAGFSRVERKAVESRGKKKTTLVAYLAYK